MSTFTKSSHLAERFVPLEQAVPSPSDGRHACSQRRHLALDLSSEEQATFIRLWHSLVGGCIVVWFVVCSSFRCCLTLYPMILRHLHPFVADRRATARTTETFSHAAISKKNCYHVAITSAFTSTFLSIHAVYFLFFSSPSQGTPQRILCLWSKVLPGGPLPPFSFLWPTSSLFCARPCMVNLFVAIMW